MKSLNKNNLLKGRAGVYSWSKHKIMQILGVLFFLFSIFLWFSFYYFDFQDYGNPYLSSSKEDIHLFYVVGSWLNGAITYWTGNTCWMLPLLPLTLGYRLFNGIEIKYIIFRIIIIFLGLLLISGGLKNFGIDGGQLSLWTFKLYIKLETLVNLENEKYILNLSGIIIGVFLILSSLDMRFRIYNKLLIFIFKNLSLLINYTFKFLYKNIIILSSIFKLKKEVAQKVTSNKKTFAKKKCLIWGREKKKKNKKNWNWDFKKTQYLPYLT